MNAALIWTLDLFILQKIYVPEISGKHGERIRTCLRLQSNLNLSQPLPVLFLLLSHATYTKCSKIMQALIDQRLIS